MAGIRWTRCTPISNLKIPNAPVPRTSKVIFEKPPMSLSLESSNSSLKPSLAVYFSYMLYKSAANKPASAPPVPARISKITSRASAGSLGSVSCSNSASSTSIRASHSSMSARAKSPKSRSSINSWASSSLVRHSINSRAIFAKGESSAYFLLSSRYKAWSLNTFGSASLVSSAACSAMSVSKV